jgi:hypothetical protein
MCTFCGAFYPGRERESEPQNHDRNSGFMGQGFKEITLLGQNVDSYLWYGGGLKKILKATEMQKATAVDFDQLLEMVAVGFQNAHSIFDFKSTRHARKCFTCNCKTIIYANTFIQFNQEAIEFKRNEPFHTRRIHDFD